MRRLDVPRGLSVSPARADGDDFHRVLLPCDCAGTCSFLVIDHWSAREEGWEDEFYADLFIRPAEWTFRARLKAAKRTLFGQQIGHDMTITAVQAKVLRDWLNGELGS